MEVIKKRTQTSKTFALGNNQYSYHHILKTVLHYPSEIDSSVLDREVDFTPQRINNSQLDGWRVSQAGWHYALGQPGDKSTDGWVGFGGRQGQNWLQSRLTRVGYLHWPTKEWQNIGNSLTYDRTNLSRSKNEITIGPQGAEETLTVGNKAVWSNIWTTPNNGTLDISWRAEGRQLKEEIIVNQEAREWITTNRPPTTPTDETYFGFVYQLDVSDIPKWVKNGVEQDINGDFDDIDGNKIEIRDAQNRLLGFMPISNAFSEEYGEEQDTIKLRKRIWRDGDNYYLLVGARVDQLNAMQAGDIVFDPTLTTQPGGEGKDNVIGHDTPDDNAGDWLGLLTGKEGESNIVRSLIEFDISSIPLTATADSATLTLYNDYDDAGSQAHSIYELRSGRSGWTEGGSTWNSYALGSSWTTAGCASTASDRLATTIATFTSPAEDTAVDITLTAGDVEDWFGSTNENYGMLIKDDTEGNWTKIQWSSSDNEIAAQRPKLVVEYTSVTRQPLLLLLGVGI